MNQTHSKSYWENIYATKDTQKVGWFQLRPALTLSLVEELAIPKDSTIIDIGGGDSYLVDYLLADDYRNVTVLDISDKAIEKAKLRLGEKREHPATANYPRKAGAPRRWVWWNRTTPLQCPGTRNTGRKDS